MSPPAAFKVDAFIAAVVSGTVAGVLRDTNAVILCVALSPVLVWLIDATMVGIKLNRLRRRSASTLTSRGARPR